MELDSYYGTIHSTFFDYYSCGVGLQTSCFVFSVYYYITLNHSVPEKGFCFTVVDKSAFQGSSVWKQRTHYCCCYPSNTCGQTQLTPFLFIPRAVVHGTIMVPLLLCAPTHLFQPLLATPFREGNPPKISSLPDRKVNFVYKSLNTDFQFCRKGLVFFNA